MHGLGLVARALSETPPSLEDLSLPNICKVACNFPNGLVLVTGPTGSGKSTTLAAMINHINTNSRGHILTLEDPVEYHHDSKRCMVNQRQFGTHFSSFASALKSSLREDPDVILVGEMRDPETMALAITAAETGHLVFATLHTNSASKTIDRILDSFPSEQQPQIRSMLSESLRCVISQKLVPSADRRGRIAFFDVLVNNSAVANLIREGKTYQVSSIMQTSRKEGMQILDQSLNEAVKQGLVSGADAWEHANDKSLFQNFAPRDMQNLGIAAAGKTIAGVTQITRKSGAAIPALPPSGKKVG
jgi:twitching motility protein PilT